VKQLKLYLQTERRNVPDISYGAYDELGQKRVFFSPPQQDKPASKDDFEESSSEENVFQPDYSNGGR
jgi:hypothetical protein